MKVLVSLICACAILYINTYGAHASTNKHNVAPGAHASPIKHYETPVVASSKSKHYETPVVASSKSKHTSNNNLSPAKLPTLSKQMEDPAYPDAERGDIKGSSSKTDEQGIPELVPSVEVEDADHYEDDIVYEYLNNDDINTDMENDIDGINIQNNYEKIINEINEQDLSEDFPGHFRKIKSIYTSILQFISQFRQFYTPVNTENTECKKDIKIYDPLQTKYTYSNGTLWSVFMADSWGKLSDGYLFGNVHIPGMYEECQKIKANYVLTEKHSHFPRPPTFTTELRNFTGRYCQVHYRWTNETSPSTRSGTVFALVKVPVPYSYGTCIPDSCTQEDMEESLNKTFNSDDNAGLELDRIVCHDKFTYRSMRSIDVIMLGTLLALVGLMVVMTLVDLNTNIFNKDNFRKSIGYKVMASWSFLANMKKIFTHEPPEKGTITCLPGIRVITMLWIVVCHQYETALDFTANTFDQQKYQDPVITQVVSNGWVSVDTFLYLGGLVLSYHMFPLLLSGKMLRNPLHFLFHPLRYLLRLLIRMCPSIIFLATFCFTLLRFLAYGPRAYILEDFVDRCDKHWWKDVIFINNFVGPHNQGHAVNDCLDHCWYTAVHFQLACVTVITLLAFAFDKMCGIIITGVCSLAAILIPLGITIAYDLPPSPLWTISLDLSFEYMWRLYLVPWCRAGPWVVGVWTALALRTNRLTSIKIPRIVVLLGYIAAISLGLTIVVGLYPYNHIMPDKKWTPVVAALYGSLSRPAWALCVAWVVFTCHTNNADMVNATLSWPGWRPLGRLTFSVYLVAPIVQMWWSTTQFVPVYYNYLSKLFESVGVLFISGLSALFLAVLVELPLLNLIGLIIPSSLSHSNIKLIRLMFPSSLSHSSSNPREATQNLLPHEYTQNPQSHGYTQNALVEVPEEKLKDVNACETPPSFIPPPSYYDVSGQKREATKSQVKVPEEELKGVNVYEEVMYDVNLYPSLNERTTSFTDEDSGRKWKSTN